MKRKGVLLINVLILFLILVIVSVPIVITIVQSSNKMTRSVTTGKATEIAYAGYKFMENYIVENEETYIKSNLDSSNKYSTTVDIPYGDGSSTMTVSVSTNSILYNNEFLKSVEIESTANYSGEISTYKDTIYFDEPYLRPKSVFPYYSFYTDDNPIYPPENPTTDNPGLLERMRVDSVPVIDEAHKEWILSQPETSYVTLTTDNYGRVTKKQLYEKMDELATLPGVEKPWQVIFIDNQTGANTSYTGDNYYTSIRMDNLNEAVNDRNRVHTFDFTNLGNDDERTSLIILSNREILVYPYWESAANSTVANALFPTLNVPSFTGALYHIKGGDIYFISYGGGVSGSNGGRIGINMSVYNPYNKPLKDIGQITIASTMSRGMSYDSTDCWIGTSKNLFIYYPNENVEITSDGTYAQYNYGTINSNTNKTPSAYAYSYTYGGIVAKSINWVGVYYKNEFLASEWKGDPRLLGFY